jgi:predicted transporter
MFSFNIIYVILIIIFGFILGYKTTKGVKSQNIRLLDIYVIGPIMIYIGIRYYILSSKINMTSPLIDKLFSLLLIFFGSTTITYNYRNYIYEKENNNL